MKKILPLLELPVDSGKIKKIRPGLNAAISTTFMQNQHFASFAGFLISLIFLLLSQSFLQAQDSAVPANTGTETPWVNGSTFTGTVTATVLAPTVSPWTNTGNIVDLSTSNYAYNRVSASYTGLGNVTVASSTISVKDGNTYGLTPLTGYKVGFKIDHASIFTSTGLGSTGVAGFGAFSATIATYKGGVPTGETYTTTTFSQDIGFNAKLDFDEARLTMSGAMTIAGTFGNLTGELKVNNAYLQRYTRVAPCNTPTPLVGPGLSQSTGGVGIWSGAANLVDNSATTHATFTTTLVSLGYNVSIKDSVLYPAGTFGGIKLTTGSLAAGALANLTTFQLKRNGAVVSSVSGASILAGSVLGADGSVTIGTVSTGDFDEISYQVVSPGLGVLTTIEVFYPVIVSFCDNPLTACNTKSFLTQGDGTNKNYPVYTTSNKSSIGCIDCTILNIDNVIDNDANNYATLSQLVSGISTLYLGVKSQETGGYPAGTFAGMEIEDVNLASAGAAIGHTISTYKNGVLQETYDDGGGLVAVKFFANTGKSIVGFKTNLDFDEIRLTTNSTLSVGSYATRIYRAVIEKFCPTSAPVCNTNSPLVRDGFPVFVDAKNTGVNTIVGVNNYISNADNAVNTVATDFASVNFVASGTAVASFAVQDGGNTYPAGTFAAFDISNTALVGLNSLTGITVSTLDDDGNVVESVDASGGLISLNSSIVTGAQRQTVGFVSTMPFTGVKITFSQGPSLSLGTINIYNAVVKKFCETTLPCNTLTAVTNPDYPVYINGKNTGINAAACIGCSLNNSDNIINSTATTPATLVMLGSAATTASVSVANQLTTYPAGTFAGFDVKSTNLFSASGLGSITISLWNNGVKVQDGTGTALLAAASSDIITGGADRQIVGIIGQVPFDEVQFSVSQLGSVSLGTIEIYRPYVQYSCPTETVPCNTTYYITNPNNSAVIDAANTGYQGVACAGCKVNDAWNAVSASAIDFGTLYNTGGAGATASLAVASTSTTYAAGTFAGFTIKKNPFLVSAGLFTGITITTFLDGVQQESKADGALFDLSVLAQLFGTPASVYNPGFYTTKPFDEVKISIGSLASAADQYVDVYGAFVDTRTSINQCNITNPDFNVTTVGVQVGGNVKTNDVVQSGTTYGSPTALAGNPGTELPTINADGTYTFTGNTIGVYQFTVPVCPNSVTVPNCPLELLTITVLSADATVKNPPVANTDIATTPLNTPVTLNTLVNDKPGNLGITLVPSTVSLIDMNGTKTGNTSKGGTATVNAATGNITYTPPTGFVGKDTVQYTVCDSHTPALCATAYQIITVEATGATNSTSAADDYSTTPKNTTLTVSAGNGVKANDVDPEGNTQTATAQTTTITGKGTLVLAADGSYTFTPAVDFTGPVEFPYTACDANGACATATLHILVTEATTPLPVKLAKFDVKKEGETAQLTWVTTEESNSDYFEVQHSVDAKNWNALGQVDSHGDSKLENRYSFVDANPSHGTNYYRLKMTDRAAGPNDASFSYSRIESVRFEMGLISVYPNPVDNVLFLTGIESENVGMVSIHNTLGQTVYAASSVSSAGINVRNLPAGIYLVRITETGGTIHTNKVVIIR